MRKFLVSVDRGEPFEILASCSCDAALMAQAAHPQASRIEVRACSS